MGGLSPKNLQKPTRKTAQVTKLLWKFAAGAWHKSFHSCSGPRSAPISLGYVIEICPQKIAMGSTPQKNGTIPSPYQWPWLRNRFIGGTYHKAYFSGLWKFQGIYPQFIWPKIWYFRTSINRILEISHWPYSSCGDHDTKGPNGPKPLKMGSFVPDGTGLWHRNGSTKVMLTSYILFVGWSK